MQEEDTQVQNIPKWITKEMCKNEYYVLNILANNSSKNGRVFNIMKNKNLPHRKEMAKEFDVSRRLANPLIYTVNMTIVQLMV